MRKGKHPVDLQLDREAEAPTTDNVNAVSETHGNGVALGNGDSGAERDGRGHRRRRPRTLFRRTATAELVAGPDVAEGPPEPECLALSDITNADEGQEEAVLTHGRDEDAAADTNRNRRLFLQRAALGTATVAAAQVLSNADAASANPLVLAHAENHARGTDPLTPAAIGAVALDSLAINVKDHGAKGDGVTDDRAAIASAIAAQPPVGGTLYFPPGTYMISIADHPDNTAQFAAGILVPGNTMLLGAGRGNTVIKLLPLQPSSTSVKSVYMVANRHIAIGQDERIVVADLTLDGNAAAQDATTPTSGLQGGIGWMRVRDVKHTRVQVRNCRGTAGGGVQERFHFEAILSGDITYQDCEVAGTSGATATGFSSDGCTNVRYLSCHAFGMTNGHGFSHNNCRNVLYVACHSYLNRGIGYNSEDSADIVYMACIAGGSADTNPATPYPFSSNQNLGNDDHGFVFAGTGPFEIAHCISERNGTTDTPKSGLFTTGAVSGRIINGVYRDNTSYGINLTGTAERTVTISGLPLTSGNFGGAANSGYAFATAGAVDLPGRLYQGQVPTMPASNVYVSNSLPVAVDIYLIGGSVSDVYIDSNLSLGPARFVRLRPQQQVALTYAAPPTWLWEVPS